MKRIWIKYEDGYCKNNNYILYFTIIGGNMLRVIHIF